MHRCNPSHLGRQVNSTSQLTNSPGCLSRHCCRTWTQLTSEGPGLTTAWWLRGSLAGRCGGAIMITIMHSVLCLLAPFSPLLSAVSQGFRLYVLYWHAQPLWICRPFTAQGADGGAGAVVMGEDWAGRPRDPGGHESFESFDRVGQAHLDRSASIRRRHLVMTHRRSEHDCC